MLCSHIAFSKCRVSINRYTQKQYRRSHEANKCNAIGYDIYALKWPTAVWNMVGNLFCLKHDAYIKVENTLNHNIQLGLARLDAICDEMQ